VIDFRCCRGFCDVREVARVEVVFTTLLSRVGYGRARRTRQDASRIADSHLVFKYVRNKVVFVIKDEKLRKNTK